jgi:hypothetical protein
MTRPEDPLARVRAINPVPVAVEPDWQQVTQNARAALTEADADVRTRTPLLGVGTSGARGGHRGRNVTVGLALCTGAAAAGLIALAPWSGSSDFLAKASAALTPSPETVLYERWEHVIAPEPGSRAYKAGASFGPEQLWIQGGSPHRYRAMLEPDASVPAAGNLATAYGVNMAYVGPGLNFATGKNELLGRLQSKLAGRPLELGGSVESPTGHARPGETPLTLTFVPSHELLQARLSVALGALLPGPHDEIVEDDVDPVSVLRSAIAEGRAHEAGETQLDGHPVLRIDFDLPGHPPADAPAPPADAPVIHAEAYAYVEPETFHPVEIVYGLNTYRFLTYEYLSEDTAHLALTDVEAQHPGASVVKLVAASKPMPTLAGR